MSKQLKQYLRNDLEARLGEDRDVVVIQLDRLSVAKANELRNRLRAEGARMTVLRNRVARFAFEDLDMSGLAGVLDGQSAIAHGGEQGVLGVSRVVNEWTKKKDAGVKVLGGYMDGKVLSREQVETLATLPSREQLLAMLASLVVAPVTDIASQLSEMIAGVARAVDAVREQKEKAA